MLGQKELLFALNELKSIVVVTDKQGIIKYVNKTFTEVYGYTQNEAIGQNPRILKTDHHHADFYKDLWDTILSGNTWQGNFKNKTKNGRELWESAKITPIIKDGNIEGFIAIKDDITSKIRLEEELFKEKYLLDELFDNTPVGIIILRPIINEDKQLKDLIVIKANPIASEIFEKLGIVGLPLKKFLHNYEDFYAKTNQMLSSKQSFEYYCKGIEKHLKMRTFPLGNNSFCMVFNDVTEYRNTITALKESEQRYSSLVEDSPALIRRFNKDGFIIYVNNYYADYYKKSINTFIGANLFDLLKGDNIKNFKEKLSLLSAQQPYIEYQQKITLEDGTIRWQRWIDRALFDLKGNIVEYQSVGMDFTRLKTTELQLEEERNKLNAIFDNSIMGIAVVNADGQVLLSNSKALQMFENNLKPLDNNYFSTVQDEDLQSVKENFKQIFSGKNKNFNVQRKYLQKDGLYFWADIFLSPIRYRSNKPIEALALIMDITKRHQIEEELIASEQKLKQLNNTKDKLFSIIAHDIKNPFNIIIGFSSILDKNYQSFSESEIKDFISKILEASEQTYKLLEDLLTWAKSQLGQLNVKKIKLSPELIIEECTDSLHSLIKNKNIKVQKVICYTESIYADIDMLKFVIRNLLHNALKFSHPNSNIEFVVYEKDENHVNLSIKDYGIGIHPEKVKILFNLEEFLSTTGTSAEKGTGLGLSLSKEMIDLNGGTIEVNSTVNEGTIFIITLPKQDIEIKDKR